LLQVTFNMGVMTAANLILIAPCSLLLGAVLQLVVARLCSARTKGILAFLFCLPAIAAVIGTMPLVSSGQAIELNVFQWDSPLALVLHVDALSLLFGFMGSCIGGLVLLYSIGYMAHDKSATRFYCTMSIFIGAFIALVYSANLFIFYICWEVVGLCSFSLVGFWYTNPESVRGARKVLLMTHIAGYGLLASILTIYFRTGTALWTDPRVGQSFTTGLFVLMLVALVAKSVQFPLHTWIPEAMAAPTPVSALLHAACYVKAGVYLAARMHSFGAWPMSWSASLVWVGTVTMAVGVMYAMVQTDLKRMLAFSTVSQIGYMMLGLGIGTPLAITAGLLHCLNHGFFKGGLFLTAGSVQHANGTRDMNQLGGLAQKMPHTTLSWLIGVGSMMGIPLMSGFASKWMLYAAALQAGWAVPAMVAWAVSLGTVFLGAKATAAVFLGPVTDATKDAHESPGSMVWGMAMLAVGSVILGVAPQLAVNLLLNPVLGALGMGAGVHVTWLGLSSDAGSFSTIGGLVLAVVSLVIGGAIYAIAYASRSTAETVTVSSGGAALAGGGIFTGGEPLSEQDRLTAGDFSGIFLQNWSGFFHWTNVDRVYLGVWDALQAISRGLGVAVTWMEQQATMLIVVLAALILAGIRWLAPATMGIAATPALPIPEPLVAACAVAAVALVVAALASKTARLSASKLFVPLMAVIALLTVAGLVVGDPWMRLGLLELGALLTIPLVAQSSRAKAATLAYATAVVVSVLTLVWSDLALEHGQTDWARALLITSVCVKLAAVPMFFWLLRLADEIPAVVLGLIIAVVDMAAFGELYGGVNACPALFTPQGVMLGAAAATSLLAALLMLTQRSLKRLLVLSTVEDVGFLLFGLASATALGTQGALYAAITHSLAKALLFTCLGTAEADGALNENTVGLAARYPVSAFGFLFGMLAMLGVPPTIGFLGRWRLYETAVQINWPLVITLIVSSILALVAYVLALTRNWWGPEPSDAPPATKEPLVVKSMIVVLVALILAVGIWPNLLEMLHWGRL
jgi:NADH:ubiquinone oxidoreductase subunit 5 (subunit L)/multisubunit Na+/H+ antiporter MnhA subunit